MVTSPPPSKNNTTISQNLSMENKNTTRDVSFSSYLNGAEKTFFLLKLTDSNQTPNSPTDHSYIGKTKVQDSHEIGVFGAEKYFQGEMDDKNNSSRIDTATPKRPHHHDKNEPQIIINRKTLPGTPSVHSESSWNSQSALLTRSPRKQTRRRRNKVQGRSFLSNIGCNCYCNDKKSVDIDDHHVTKTETSNKSLSKTWAEEKMNVKKIDEKGIVLNREDVFSFPILGNANPQKEDDKIKIDDDPMHSSLEVFGSPIVQKGNRSLSIEKKKKQSMLSWDTEEEAEEEIETLESQNGAYNDNVSEASSDLFEIESFSTNTNSILARETSTCYAPSEASIEWSVVTADYEDTRNNSNPMGVKSSTVGEGQKWRQGILTGCKSQKAVSVAGDAIGYRTNYNKSVIETQRKHGFNSLKPVTRFQPEAESGFDRIRAVRSRTPNLLYIG